ncbi:MAG TPA: delta-60 repeat domain-containing protein, partial [Thiobacillaceae bacterium]
MKRRIGITRSTAIGLGLAAVAGVALAAVGGVLDTRFGNNGTVTTAIGGAGINEARAVTIQVDNKIVVAGYAPAALVGGAHFTLTRYNTGGTLDTTFSADGIVTTVVNSTKLEYATAIAIQPDGKILVAGSNNTGGSTPG